MKRKNMILIIPATFLGLTAGVFYCWSVSVTRGLGALPDQAYILAFQALNREIQNPLFFLCFFGTVVMLPLSTWQSYAHPLPPRFWLLLSAAAIYMVGVMAVTIFGNIPLNESLDAFHVASSTAKEITDKRNGFENPWNHLNTIRTLSAVVSLVLTLWACLAEYHISPVSKG